MPVDSRVTKDQSSYQLHQYAEVDPPLLAKEDNLASQRLHDAVMEPAPVKITHVEEIKAWAKEKFGRILGNKTLEKEGIAIEKAAHPNREWAKADVRLQKIVADQKRVNYGRRFTLS